MKEEKPSTSSTSRAEGSRPEHSESKRELKAEAEGLDTQISPGHKTKGIGDDSNAPNPDAGGDTVKDEKPMSRTTPGEGAATEDEPAETPQRKGGHQTKVVRRTLSDDKGKAVSSAPEPDIMSRADSR
jgi:hypothetical protein